MTESKFKFGQLVSIKINGEVRVFRVAAFREYGPCELYCVVHAIDDEYMSIECPESMLEAV